MSYTIRNLRDVEDAAVKHGFSELQRLDAVRFASSAVRAFEAGPDGMELLVFGPRHDGDGELLRDFWPSGDGARGPAA